MKEDGRPDGLSRTGIQSRNTVGPMILETQLTYIPVNPAKPNAQYVPVD